MDCPSCGATGQTKARCEACGFTFAMAADDDDGALSLFLGLVCETCDAYNDPGSLACSSCGAALHLDADTVIDDVAKTLPSGPPPAPPPAPAPPLTLVTAMSAPPSWMTPPTGNPLSTQFALKKVDLALLTNNGPAGLVAPHSPPTNPLSTLPTAPAPSQPVTTAPQIEPPVAPAPTAACWRCSNQLEAHDKFCRNCGARTDGGVGSAPAAPPSGAALTQMMQSLKLPAMAKAAPGAPGATMVLPALKLGGVPAVGQAGGPTTTMMFGAATTERVAKLILVRGQSQFGSQWRLQAGETVIGRNSGMVLFPDDTALAPRHARLVFRGPDLFLEPELTQNGVFLRLRGPARLLPGDEFVIGAQRLQLLRDNDRPVALAATSDADGTRLLGSQVKPNPPIAIARIGSDQRFHEVYFRAQRLLTVGRVHCDVNFGTDGFVSERHAQLTNEGSHVTIEDLKSRNGTYLRVTQPTKLLHGDLFLVGDQVLRIELPQR